MDQLLLYIIWAIENLQHSCRNISYVRAFLTTPAIITNRFGLKSKSCLNVETRALIASGWYVWNTGQLVWRNGRHEVANTHNVGPDHNVVGLRRARALHPSLF